MDVQQLIDYLTQNKDKFGEGARVTDCLLLDSDSHMIDVVAEHDALANPPSDLQLAEREAQRKAEQSLSNAINRKRPDKPPISIEEALRREKERPAEPDDLT